MDTVSGWKQSGRKKLFQSVKNRVTNRNTIQKNHLLVIRMKEKRRFVKSKKKQTVKFFSSLIPLSTNQGRLSNLLGN